MLRSLTLEPVAVDHARYLPPMLLPLVQAAEAGEDLVPSLMAIVANFGFDGFMYAIAKYHIRPDNQEQTYVFTTLPRDWVVRYDQQAYVECDPRVLSSFESALPLVWDQSTESGKSRRTDEFLADAAAHGVGSGVSFSIHTGFPARALVSLSSGATSISAARRDEIASALGQIILFGLYFHEVFLKGVVQKGLAPQSRGSPLSPREKQCLQMAANGMTSADIGIKLGITERTANFHFSNLIAKLGVLNRQEAIAKGVSEGLVRIR